MKTVGMVQARMGSTRLPGKVMRDLCGKPLIFHIFDRMRRVDGLDGLVLATTGDTRNDGMCDYVADAFGAVIVRAEVEDDIAERLAKTVQATGADHLLKINGDCPLVDIAVMQLHLDALQATLADYISNKAPFTWPLGLSTEVISAQAILRADAMLKTAAEREFICSHIKNDRVRYSHVSVTHEGADLSRWDLCIDTYGQYEMVRALFLDLYPDNPHFGLPETLRWLDAAESRPELDLDCLKVPESVWASLNAS